MKLILAMALALLGPNALAGLLVTEVSGKAEIEGKGMVTTLAEIPDGAHLILPAGAQVIAIDLGNGREFAMKGRQRYVVAPGGPMADGKPVEAKALPAKNLPYQHDARLAKGAVAQASLVMRGVRKDNVPVLVSPVRTAVIKELPVFRWNAVDAVNSYRLLVTNSSRFSIWDVSTTETELTLPADRRLVPGERYTWRVEAIGDGGKVSDASATFSVAPAESISRLAQLKPEADAPFGRRVLYAVQLREAGALAEAKQVWKALSRERPDDEVIKALAE